MRVQPLAVGKGVRQHHHQLVFRVAESKRSFWIHRREARIRQGVGFPVYSHRAVGKIDFAENIPVVHVPLGVRAYKLSLKL